ncbi:MAG TPA: 4Fe-4S dicluster domain-containing protein [Sedimenticola thiotaurini]|uniref:Indolepyruvate oxidoreductase subunit IorA n=1 Tax=Sedimenticola thiotaurini TaxID=1543721 RepID=A0A831W6K1_9GAMM|nr:4Fe-4S dicluster domain-containing protein [Sedimenticola thiotaurini]
MSGNEAVALGAWTAGCRVAAAYPGTPSTEILEYASQHRDMYTEWSINEKVSLEVAIGASLAGSRALCAMKHVGLNVASDALMTQTLVGVKGGLVIAVADDVGLSSSQNEQDSRHWGRFAHVPVLEPADAQEAHDMTITAFDLSERFGTPVILRLTTRVCHVKGVVVPAGERQEHVLPGGFEKNPARLVMTPANARHRIPLMYQREEELRRYSGECELNRITEGDDRRIGFVASGPAFMHVREAFPDAPVLKLGLSHPAPMEQIRQLAGQVEQLVVVEEVEPILETEIKAAGIDVVGKEILPRIGELAPHVLRPAIAGLLGEPVTEEPATAPAAPPAKAPEVKLDPATGIQVFPRPPTMCVACPHLGIYYCLSKIKNTSISGDIGCYTLGAGEPWNALDTTICMGASMGVALGLDKGRTEEDRDKKIIAVIGDSTFMHMGMQGLLDITYNRGNVTILLLDNRAVGMTGGQFNPASGRDIHGEEAMQVDFRRICEALGVKSERIHEVNPYELPVLFKALREEIKIPEPSVIITNQPCVLVEFYGARPALTVDAEKCTGCGNCLDVGCPAIFVTRRETVVKPNGKEKELAFVDIDTAACTGCDLCPRTCGPDAIVPLEGFSRQ